MHTKNDRGENPENAPEWIAAVGASAGGLDALQQLFSNFPPELTDISVIVAQHLSPRHKSMLVQLLGKYAPLNVVEAKNGTRLEPGTIYITPPDREVTVKDHKICLKKPANPTGPKPSVNVLLDSLAAETPEHTIGIILSGTGTDGAEGVKSLKNRGGFILVQEPQSAKYDGMPNAAIASARADSVLTPNRMGTEILNIISNPKESLIAGIVEIEKSTEVQQVFKVISERIGVDFSNYKSATFGRRLLKRITTLKMSSVAEYLNYLKSTTGEAHEMFKTVLIGVTSFFRDNEAFQNLETQIRSVISGKKSGEPIRIWIPGCSTGEEAYSIAIMLSEILGDRLSRHNIQIFATDIDERAIQAARRGIYSAESLKNTDPHLTEKYFTRTNDGWELDKQIRSLVLFSKHDLTQNPPFVKLDLISCRNLLIYFNAGLQHRILPVFHYALNPNGILLLGKSETVGKFTNLFAPIDKSNRIYRRKEVKTYRDLNFNSFKAPTHSVSAGISLRENQGNPINNLIRETLFKSVRDPFVIVNDQMNLVQIQGDVRLFMTLPSGDFQMNLSQMVNKELRIEVRSLLVRCINTRNRVESGIKSFNLFNRDYYVRITAQPLVESDYPDKLYMVTFENLEIQPFLNARNLPEESSEESEKSHKVAELEHELATVREHIQSYIEEIESSNEELQSLNEELQGTNEELQSVNEELETSNEELQSSNEEVQIAYNELKETNEQLEQKEKVILQNQAAMKALLDNQLQGFILTDHRYQIIRFNQTAEDIFAETSGKKLDQNTSLIDYIDTDQLNTFISDLKRAVNGESVNREQVIRLKNGKMRWYRINLSPAISEDESLRLVSLGMLDITELKESLSNLNKTEQQLSSVFEATTTGICISDQYGNIESVNKVFCNLYGYSKEELIGKPVSILVPDAEKDKARSSHDEFISSGSSKSYEQTARRKDGSRFDAHISEVLLVHENEQRFKVSSVRDVTERNKTRKMLAVSQKLAKLGAWEFMPDDETFEYSKVIPDIFGYNDQEPLKLESFLGFFAEDDRKKLNRAIQEAHKKGVSFDLEFRVSVQNTGKWVRIYGEPELENGVCIRLYGAVQDITARKSAQVLLESITNNIPASIFRYKCTEQGDEELLYLSKQVEETTQVPLEKLSDEPDLLWKMTHPDDREAVKQTIQESSENLTIWKGEFRLVYPDGSFRWFRGAGLPQHEPDGSTIWDMVLIDVNEEILAKERLAESENRFRSLVESTDDIIFTLDKNQRLTGVYGKWKTTFKIDENDLLGKTAEAVLGPKSGGVHQKAHKKALKGESVTYEWSAVAGNRRYTVQTVLSPIYDSHGSITGTVGVGRNISDIIETSNRLKKALRDLEDYKYALDHAAYIVLTDADGFIIEVNDKTVEASGYTRDELIGQSTAINNSGYHPDSYFKEMWETISSGQIWRGDIRNKTKGGGYYWVDTTIIPFLDKDGNPFQYLAIRFDITRQKNEEERLRLLESVILNSSDSVLVTEADPSLPEGHQIIFVNQAFTKMTGYTAEEVIGKTPKILQGPKTDRNELRRIGESIRKWQPCEAELINYTKDGQPFWINFTLNPVADETGWYTHWIAIEKDITERKSREIQKHILAELSEVFHGTGNLDSILPEALRVIVTGSSFNVAEIWFKLPGKKELNRAALYPEDEKYEAFFSAADDILKLKDSSSLVCKAFKKGEAQIWRNIQNRKTFQRWEAAAATGLKTAYSIPLLYQGETIAVLLLVIDEDVRSEWAMQSFSDDFGQLFGAEIRRKQLEEELRNIFNSTQDIILVAGLDGYYKKVNPYASKILEYSEKELCASPFTSFIHPHDREESARVFAEIQKSGESVYHENRFITKSGSTKWLAWTVTPKISEGVAYAVAKDITEQKELELLYDKASRLARIGTWELNFVKEEFYWSDVTKEIHQVPASFKPDIDKSVALYKEGPHRERIQEIIQNAVLNGTAWDEELLIVTANGKERWIRNIGEAEVVDGLCVRIYGSIQDIDQRKRAEMSFKSVLQERNKILESISDAFYAVDENLNFSYYNKEAERLLRLSPGKVIGKKLWDVFSHHRNTDLQQAFEQCLGSQIPKTIEFYDGKIKTWLEISIYPSGKRLSVYFRDISDQKAAREKLEKAYQEKNAILESIGDGFFAVDKNWIVTYWNKRAEELLKINREDVLGNSLKTVYQSENSKKFFKHYEKALENQKSVNFVEYSTPLGIWIEVTVNPSANGLSVYFRDISERILSQEKIRESNERFEQVAKATRDAIWDWDIENDTFFYNESYKELFGYDPKDFSNTLNPWLERLHPEDRHYSKKTLDNALNDPATEKWESEYRFLKADSEYAYVFDRGWLIRDKNGKATRMVGAMSDISEQKQFEKSLEKLNLELEDKIRELASSNDELEQFAYVASHDLQEPLRMITSFMAQLEKKYGDLLDERGKKYIYFATDGAKRMRQIILDLLEFSRVGRIETKRDFIKLNEVLEDVLALNRKSIEEKVAEILSDDLPEVYASRSSVQQVFQNLISNALKYQKPDARPKVEIKLGETDLHWEFTVRDNGVGFNPDYADRIFNIFQRVHSREEYSGTGMGLAICKKVIEQHGGTISVKTEEGKGSAFTFTLSKHLNQSPE